MKVSREWLEEYSNIDVSTKELADILTMTGSKVEGIEYKGNDIKNVVIGKILEIEKHPDADKLVITKVDVGTEIIQIVTGANNINVNDIVPIAKDGSELPGGIKIKKGMLRGIESCGMMCSMGELNLTKEQYPDAIEDGILILSKDLEKDIGKDAVEILELKEEIIEFEITPNRPDCLSVEGLGRETAVSLNKEFKGNKELLTTNTVDTLEGLTVLIDAPEDCYRYAARVIKNVKIEASPKWMQRRLNACGVRAINNIVDITNYVMLELGQPMHAFDINHIEGKNITVRRAKDGEKITTLDEEERILNGSMLVIADDKNPVAVAGVMGGINSGIEENTNIVVFESAVFNGGNIRKTASKLGLRTEASSRYEKGLSAENAMKVVNRAVELAEKIGAGKILDGAIDVYPTKQEKRIIKLDEKRINGLLGTNISKEEMIKILEKLEIKISGDNLEIPAFRQDIEGIADISEEVLRFFGYNKLESTLIKNETTLGAKNKEQKIEDEIKKSLVNKGLHEIYTYGFINEKDLSNIRMENTNSIKVINPLSEDYTIMRKTTISSMMKALSYNFAKKNQDIGLFEISRVYVDNGNIEKEELPTENNVLTIGFYSKDKDYYNLKGIVENILKVLGLKYDVLKEEINSSFHPGRTAKVAVGNDVLGIFGEIHPMVRENYDISEKVYIAEINFDKLVRYTKSSKKYSPIPKYPSVERDLSIVVDEDVQVADIEKVIKKYGKKILENIKLFDVYRSANLGENKKSIAYSLSFRSFEKTLTDEEISGTINNIISNLGNEFNAVLRS